MYNTLRGIMCNFTVIQSPWIKFSNILLLMAVNLVVCMNFKAINYLLNKSLVHDALISFQLYGLDMLTRIMVYAYWSMKLIYDENALFGNI